MSFGTKVKIGSIGALALLAISGSLNAAPSFELIQGDVALVQAGSKMKAAIGQSLGGSATVLSSGDGKAVIRFDDGQVVTVTGNTEFKVVNYHYDKANPANSKSELELVKGEIRYVAGALAGEANKPVKITSQGSVISPAAGSDFVAATGSLYISIGAATPDAPIVISQNGQTFAVTKPGFYEIKMVTVNGVSTLQAVEIPQASMTAVQQNVAARMGNVTQVPVNGTALPTSNAVAYKGTTQIAAQAFSAAGGQTLAVSNAALGAFTITAPVALGAAVAAVTLAATGNDKNSTTGTTGTTGTTP
ncbi:MAG: FecR family protein [Rhodocyclales bacterium]|nr:FecR family protein [Rhodocyclales bacterium]